MSVKNIKDELKVISETTLDHYNRNADNFWEGTRDHDVSQNIHSLLRNLSGEAPYTILDFGCGPGRDLITFTELGHKAVGLEGSHALAALARKHSGCDVLEQNFLSLNLPDEKFDGIFANASLFHVPSQQLATVLHALNKALKSNGVLFSSNPRGDNQEGWNGDRYGTYHDLDSWRVYLQQAGFSEIEHYYRPPGLPIHQQPWLASVWRKN